MVLGSSSHGSGTYLGRKDRAQWCLSPTNIKFWTSLNQHLQTLYQKCSRSCPCGS